MAKPVSKTVDAALKRCWARLATATFKRALTDAEEGAESRAENRMEWVESWLKKAGAEATKWHFP